MTEMGRNRGGKWADRPRNVDLSTVRGKVYFRYAFPDGSRKTIGSAENAPEAFATAEALNAHFRGQGRDLRAVLKPSASPRNPTVPTLVGEFKRLDGKRRKYSERSRSEQDIRLNVYARKWANLTLAEVDTHTVALALNELTDSAYVKHRADLLKLFQFAGHQGYVGQNPVAMTLTREEGEKVRQRHTWEGYQAILKAAPDWLARAMRIGLYSLQRRDDVVNLHKSAVNLEAGTITVLQRKTRTYKNPVHIEIEMGPELLAAVQDCIRSPILCPYLIHRKPIKMRKREAQAGPHPFAIIPGFLSKEFRKVRDECGAYEHLEPAERPTFHELRALGSHLYQKAGYSEEYIMALSGHSKAETLQRYLKDHRQTMPRRVSAGLNQGQLPR